MPIPLGVLAVAGAGAGPVAGGTYDLIESQILTGTQATVEFTNLNTNYGSTYQHLQLRITARSNRANAYDLLRMRFNGATGSVYSFHYLFGNGSLVDSDGGSTQTGMLFYRALEGNNATADTYGFGVFDILDPFETTKNTTVRALEAYVHAAESVVSLSSGLYQATTAVSSIELDSSLSSSFIAGSRFSLYGMRSS
jgi:hypothetical protein